MSLFQLTSAQRLDRDLHQLEGIVRGIAIDGIINETEQRALEGWCQRHSEASKRAPFTELIPKVRSSIEDGQLDLEEREDILWLIEQARTPNAFYNVVTSDLQRLHGVLAGISADGLVNDKELRGMARWCEDAHHLRNNWPYDEVCSIVTHVLADGVITPQEHKLLVNFCREFAGHVPHLLLKTPIDEGLIRHGVCRMDPEITFPERRFCVTGASPKKDRQQIYSLIAKLGGLPHDTVVVELDFLIVCDSGNRSWAFSCYGRKVEKAMKLRREGSAVAIVHETDFWDAVRDCGIEP